MNDRSFAEGVAAHRLQLGELVLDRNAGELLTSGRQLAGLRKQALDVLLVLGARPGQVVSKNELMHLVWPQVVVGEGSLTQAISDVRRVLGDNDHRLVRNISRRGYMLVPDPMPDPMPDPVLADAPADTALEDVALAEPAPAVPTASAGPAPGGQRRWRAAATAAFVLGSVLTGWIAWDGLVASPQDPPTVAREPLADSVPSISLVVLPLAIEGDAMDTEWLADALLDDLIVEAGRIKDSLVIARGTAQSYKGKAVDPRDVARELRVRYVVQGRLRYEAETIRLSLALVDGDTGAQRWSERFVVERVRLGHALDEFVLQLARALSVEVTRSAGARAATLSGAAVSAEDVAMRGGAIYRRGLNRHNLIEALAQYELAVAMNPDSTRGWGGIAIMSQLGGHYGWLPDRSAAFQRVAVASANLDRLDPDGFLSMQAKTVQAFNTRDGPAYLRASKAWADRHRHPVALGSYGFALIVNGAPEESLAPLELALRLSPRDVFRADWQYRLALAHFLLGHYEQARDWGQSAQAANPTLPWPPVHAAALVRLGSLSEGRQVLDDLMERQRGYDAARVVERLDGTEPRFLEGRDRLIASLREVGLR